VTLRTSVAVDPAVDDADTIADAQLALTELVQRDGAARIEPDNRAIPIALVRLFNLVADNSAADCAGDCRRRIAATAAKLVADDATSDAAEDRTQVDG